MASWAAEWVWKLLTAVEIPYAVHTAYAVEREQRRIRWILSHSTFESGRTGTRRRLGSYPA
jgi:hypothetical protein